MLERAFGLPQGSENSTVRKNYRCNILDGALYAFGMSLVSQQTVLPVFIRRLGGENIAVGLIPVLWTAGFNFPQIFSARMGEVQPLKKKTFLRTSFIQRLPWLIWAVLSFTCIRWLSPAAGIAVVLSLFTLAAVAGSVNFPVWFDLITKLTPANLRGRLFAARNFFGALLGIGGGWIAAWVLQAVPSPESFGILFSGATVAIFGSYFFLLRLDEDRPSLAKTPVPHAEYVRSLRTILTTDRRLRAFLAADALQIGSSMASGFFIVSAMERFQLPDSSAGAFTVAMMAATIVGNLGFGHLADHCGHRINMMLGALLTAAASLISLAAPSAHWFYLVFVCTAATTSLTGISRLGFIAELCPEEHRPTYIALTNMITSPFVLFGILGGWAANVWGFQTVFAAAGVMALCSLAIWFWKVEDPRSRTSGGSLPVCS